MKPHILYEDQDIIVCLKPAGIPTQTSRPGLPDMVSILKNHIYQNSAHKKQPYLAVIHRLDQPVEGLLVFAKTQKAASALSAQLQKDAFSKDYLALLSGQFAPDNSSGGTLTNYLIKDGKTNTSRVVSASEPGAKKSVLHYEVLEQRKNCTLVSIHLETGRHHQIRVQTSAAGHPIVGDRKYGVGTDITSDKGTSSSSFRFPALCAYHLAFRHPGTGKPMEFKIRPEWL